MQFVHRGPDIPERLIQAHEDGRVVFFCGAGISYPARLPGFAGLVSRLYSALGIATPNAVQGAAIKAGQFDTAIGLLESDIMGGREVVRPALAAILTPDLTSPKSTATHEALLTLGKVRDGHFRLITTNFDRIFESIIESKRLGIASYQAPLLPIPKTRWDGLVYLHGLLSAAPTPSELNRLVISSGDFGLAYLTERWAARFVSELFRNYTVCFVGYSINDPVLRYMMDALAADRLLGESTPEMFAFGSYSTGKEDLRANEWHAKNVFPILYREHNHHTYLHQTLQAWAKTYRDGVQGKERIVAECAVTRPMASTKQDDYIGRLLWALSDPKGLPAKHFAEFDPVPSLEWLEPLSDQRYVDSDLGRFGVIPQGSRDEKLTFSLTSRPTPYSLAPWMNLVDGGFSSSSWDEIMKQLARWLVRHLDDPKLLLWLIKRGGKLHEEMNWWIERRIDELAKLAHDGRTDDLEAILKNAPNAVPGDLMRALWRLLLTRRVKTQNRNFDLFRWRDRFRRDGLTATLRFELRDSLTPMVALSEPYQRSEAGEENEGTLRINDLVEWDIELASEHPHTVLQELENDQRWLTALPELLFDFSTLLRDALDLRKELGGADADSDFSYIHQPSIEVHPQNRDFHDWTALIDLTRNAWVATAEALPEQALLAVEIWSQTSYPIFRRLALFAASQGRVVPLTRAIELLLDKDHWWLWSVETEREAIRLLVSLAPQLDEAMLMQLEQAILIGPPRSMYRDDIEQARWTGLVDKEIWLRLMKMQAGGATLSRQSIARLAEISAAHTQWRLEEDDRDEFPYWMGDGDELRKFVSAPRRRRDLVEWIRQQPTADTWQEDDWREMCRDNFATTSSALISLASEGIWPEGRWREALQAWSVDKHVRRSWRYIGPILLKAPDKLVEQLAHGIGWWLQSIAKTFEGREENFFTLASRVLTLEDDEANTVDTVDMVGRAINHPTGIVTEALLLWWYRRSLEDGQGLPDDLKQIFSQLADVHFEKYRHARILLASNLIALFRVDTVWTTAHLVPLFDWQHIEVEARAVWQGFMRSPRLYRPTIEAIKPYFLDTASHYAELGQYKEQYAALLTYAALDPADTFKNAELALAIRSLPPEGLHDVAKALQRGVEGAGDQRSDYWTNRVRPFLQFIWPKSRDNATPAISETFALLCVAADADLPNALLTLRAWIQHLARPDFVVHRLHASGLCSEFPLHTLDLLNLIIGNTAEWLPRDLGSCLASIAAAAPELENDVRYQRLMAFFRQNGGD